MAQINITLNQEEILQLLKNNSQETFKILLENSLNEILKAESAQQLQAEPYERTAERTDSRNGHRERSLVTRIGKITLKVPRHRNVPFRSLIFDNYTRSEAALIATMVEMVVNGVSTRKVSKVVEELCGCSFSKSTVSELCKELDEEVRNFRERPLTQEYPLVTVDATYFKAREGNKVIAKAMMIACATSSKGIREIIGFKVYDNESKESWKDFFSHLKERGLRGVILLISDCHEGIRSAASKEFPNAAWQRCQRHFAENIIEDIPKKYQRGIANQLNEMFNSETIEEARARRDEIIEEYEDVAEKAMKCLDEGFEEAMTIMELPKEMRKTHRTTNRVERLNRELKRRSNVICVFPNEASITRLIGAVLIEEHEKLISMSHHEFYKPAQEELQEKLPRLREIAKEQQAALKAA